MRPISLVVTSYNQLDYLKKALDSAAQQTYPFYEIVVVDDHSTDGSADYLRGWSAQADNRKAVFHEKNKGRSATRNSGFAHVTGKYVAFLDGDDWLDANMCEVLSEASQDGRPDLIFFGHKNYNEALGTYVERTHGNQFLSQEPLDCPSPHTDEEIAELFRLIPATWMKLYRREFLSENSILSEGKYYEDTLWTLRCLAHASTIRCVPKTLIYYRFHGASLLHQCSKVHFALFDISDQCEGFLSAAPELPDSFTAASRRFRYNISSNALLNTDRIPPDLKPQYAKNILERGELLTFGMDDREAEILNWVREVALG